MVCMATNIPTNEHPVVTALHEAYDLALQNLTDCTYDDPQLAAKCAADVAALSHLLDNDGTGRVNVLAYLA